MAYGDPNTETLDEVKNNLHDDHYIAERFHAHARTTPGAENTNNMHRDVQYDHLAARQALGDFLPIGPGHPRLDEYNKTVNSSQAGQPHPIDGQFSSDGSCQHCHEGIMKHLASQNHTPDWRPTEAIPEDHYAFNEDALYKAELKRLVGERLQKAIADLKAGPQVAVDPDRKSATYSYSHLLSPEHIKDGYRISMDDRSDPEYGHGLHTSLLHNGRSVGLTTANINPKHPLKPVSIDVAEISDGTDSRPSFGNGQNHRGKGLGMALYESVLAHAKHHHGSELVEGASHSTSASRVHAAISKKHGLGYEAKLVASRINKPEEDYDAKNHPYSYDLK